MTDKPTQRSQLELLHTAVTEPGVVAKCFKAFWNYSFGNQLDAYSQCLSRDMDIGPVNTYKKWQTLGRQVTRGQKAIWMTVPRIVKGKTPDEKDTMFFRYVGAFFVFSQTEPLDGWTGKDYTPDDIPDWNLDRALVTLNVTQVPFDMLNGNVQGYAKKRTIAISPVAQHPHQTTFHELAHVVLGHTTEADFQDDKSTPVNQKELEAECVALLCAEALGLEGAAESRGYIQTWWKEKTIPKDVATTIMKVANQIMKAGRPTTPKEVQV